MRCPHCSVVAVIELRTAVSFAEAVEKPGFSDELDWRGVEIAYGQCPACQGLLISLRHGGTPDDDSGQTRLPWVDREERIYPMGSTRPLPDEVPDAYKAEFVEACKVEGVSPKASAALSRRLLQKILREQVGIERRTLAEEISEFIAKPGVPATLADTIDSVRVIGNFAAHPLKSERTGEVQPVEPGEAEWTLGVLEALFDHVFVQPARLSQRKVALKQKLEAAGRG